MLTGCYGRNLARAPTHSALPPKPAVDVVSHALTLEKGSERVEAATNRVKQLHGNRTSYNRVTKLRQLRDDLPRRAKR